MRPVRQTKFRDPDGTDRGNCLQAALASILELDLTDVPHFIEREDAGEGHWLELANAWLEASYGLRMIKVAYIEFWHITGFAIGTSPRDDRTAHIVVAHDRRIAWDPHPDDTGLVGDPETWSWWVLAATDPGQRLS